MDGAYYVFICLNKRHKSRHHAHSAGQSLLCAIAGIDGLSGFAQHKHVFPVAPPRLAGDVFLLSLALW